MTGGPCRIINPILAGCTVSSLTIESIV
jgi:hypothetical protein